VRNLIRSMEMVIYRYFNFNYFLLCYVVHSRVCGALSLSLSLGLRVGIGSVNFEFQIFNLLSFHVDV
jgi:hypothetical protein